MFENPDLVDGLIGYETIEEEIDDLTIDMIEFLKQSKDVKYIDFPARDFVGIQASILDGDLTYTFMFVYKIKDLYQDEEGYSDARGSLLVNVIFNNFKLDRIQGTILTPNGEEEYIQYYPVFEKPNLKGRIDTTI